MNEDFRRVSQAASFAEGEGLCGRAWRSRDLIFVKDLAEMTDCVRAQAAQRAGVKSAICFPVLMKGQVLGTIDLFAQEARTPSAERLEVWRTVGRLISASLGQFAAMEASRKRVRFVEAEVGRVVRNLERLAAGDLNLDLTPAAIDEDTRIVAGNFVVIDGGLDKIGKTVQRLYGEMSRLTEASREGQLSERGKPDEFQGAYGELAHDRADEQFDRY